MKPLGAVVASALVALVGALASTDTITWGGDNTRSGFQTNHRMDPAIVGSSQFGQVFRTPLPGTYVGQPEQIFSQPLVYTPNGGTKQYVYFATTQNNVYRLDSKTGEILASRNLHIPFLTADLDGCVDINPTIGVTSTGVIDYGSDTLYLMAKTYVNQKFGDKPQGRPAGRYYLHALDVNDLSERPNFPVDLEGILSRNGDNRMFTGGIHLQRPALLLTGQYIYAGFASHCVQYNFTGWIMGWDKATGKVIERWSTQGKGVPNTVPGAGIWMSGGGLSSDDAGSIYLATGNGYASQLSNIPVKGFNPPTALEEAALHMTMNADGSLNLVDFFMPWEKQALDGADKDLGTSPLEMLPSQFACGDVKRVGVVTGKTGKTYWLNLDNLGGYRNGKDGLDDVLQVFQNENSVYAGAGVYPLEGGWIYINVVGYPTNVFKFSCNDGVPAFTKVAVSPTPNAYILGVSHGTVTSLDGQEGTGLLWVTDVQGVGVKVYNAVPKNGNLVLLNSFNVPGITKFTRPVFGDGMLYVGTTLGYVYGFGAPVNAPLNCSSPVDFGNVNIKNSSSTESVTCKATIDLIVTGIGLGEKKHFGISDSPKLPLQLLQGQSFSVDAVFRPTGVGFQSVDLLINTTNGIAGYSTETHARLTGTGRSVGALLALSPTTITFKGIVTGQDPGGVSESLVVSNRGSSPLNVISILYSVGNSTGPFQPWDGHGNLVVGKFTLQNVPTAVAANSGVTVSVAFNSTTSGTFTGFVKFVTDGGNGTVSIAGSSGPAAIALLEFQTPDGQGWVKYQSGTPFNFGNVTENTSRSLKFRVTNNAPPGGVKLSLTVSKPPFGVASIVRAANQVDLAEGSSFGPGESGTAVLTCAAPKSQWNVASYNGTAQWTMNTNDPGFGKQFIQFLCNAVAEQAPPLLPSGQGQFRYIGCYKDNTPGRQLPNQLIDADKLTNAQCIAACAKNSYIFCGLEYGGECWCGNQLGTGSVHAPDVDCGMTCTDNTTEFCGGPSRLNVYRLGPTTKSSSSAGPTPTGPAVKKTVGKYESQGCWTEATNSRALLGSGSADDKMTLESCAKFCDGFKYFATEYGRECYCGNSLQQGSVKASNENDCSFPCAGDASEYCGAGNRIQLYKIGATPSPSTAPDTSSTGSGSSKGLPDTPTVTSSPIVWPGNANFTFYSCVLEPSNGRLLELQVLDDGKNMTIDRCLRKCWSYSWAGVEYGRECWCGDKLNLAGIDGATPGKNVTKTECDMLCPGDKKVYCGAGVRMSLYSNNATTTT
ncbi:WSC domain-containing protein [Hirsutella rhossiliensis]|uniref:WSC domain-containing protein n=1 Tax=Hirsutella rhossiliensis TaxID=111463 RepID=A0A9P8MN90_9HYPO|nr:WSC domain-containing protein [Hirsutella rhossiliensis]KAH0958255.1 WSC domain-containing protein [Hirsutella rhossiliensis]